MLYASITPFCAIPAHGILLYTPSYMYFGLCTTRWGQLVFGWQQFRTIWWYTYHGGRDCSHRLPKASGESSSKACLPNTKLRTATCSSSGIYWIRESIYSWALECFMHILNLSNTVKANIIIIVHVLYAWGSESHLILGPWGPSRNMYMGLETKVA